MDKNVGLCLYVIVWYRDLYNTIYNWCRKWKECGVQIIDKSIIILIILICPGKGLILDLWDHRTACFQLSHLCLSQANGWQLHIRYHLFPFCRDFPDEGNNDFKLKLTRKWFLNFNRKSLDIRSNICKYNIEEKIN